MAIRILAVDPDPKALDMLRFAFVREGHDLITAADGETALRICPLEQPDLVILEATLPGLDGFTVCERLRANSSVPILMLSGRGAVPDRVTGLAHGADGYLVKPFAVEELLARIGALLRRTQAAESPTLSFGDVCVDVETHEACRGEAPLRLTPREYQLLVTFLHNPRQVLSRDQLARQAWGFPFRGESNFVDVTVKDLRRKMEVGGRQRLIQTDRGFGYSLRAA
jgi:two-component system response regulator MprA